MSVRACIPAASLEESQEAYLLCTMRRVGTAKHDTKRVREKHSDSDPIIWRKDFRIAHGQALERLRQQQNEKSRHEIEWDRMGSKGD
mgnify:CR=1 FL=1|jgi:hypothetical protein